jgi:hypothetical protein
MLDLIYYLSITVAALLFLYKLTNGFGQKRFSASLEKQRLAESEKAAPPTEPE